MFTIQLPIYGILYNLYIDNSWISSAEYVLGAMFLTSFFTHSLVLSCMRFCAVKFPLKYHKLITIKKIIIVIIGMILFDLSIGVGTLFFPATYEYISETRSLIAKYKTKLAVYYMIFYGLTINGIIIIISFILNVLNWYTIYKKKDNNSVKTKKDIVYGFYTFITFISTLLYYTYYVLRVIGTLSGEENYNEIANILITYVVEVVSLVNFYFLLIVSQDLRKLILKFTYLLIKKKN
uniref:G-protein coupled receptors family 1 profile domain-containing protein n=1 Tax=Strongyloides stercoralis TaxID=6248 RepID=A0A0K0E4U3_STRER